MRLRRRSRLTAVERSSPEMSAEQGAPRGPQSPTPQPLAKVAASLVGMEAVPDDAESLPSAFFLAV